LIKPGTEWQIESPAFGRIAFAAGATSFLSQGDACRGLAIVVRFG